MFAGFNVKITDYYWKEIETYYEDGKNLLSNQKKYLENQLKKYICEDGKTLNASLIEEDWFPEVKADVFLSHSHADEKKVVALAGWLYKNFGVTSFIDSYVWGYSNNLLQLMDNNYSLIEKNDRSITYNYKKTMITSSHVHMMLAMALAKMIDKTECLFFINTPNSISVEAIIRDEDATFSPWIYEEIKISQIIEKKEPKRYNKSVKENAQFQKNDIQIKYDVDLNHLFELTDADLKKWSLYKYRGCNNLDILYLDKKIIENF